MHEACSEDTLTFVPKLFLPSQKLVVEQRQVGCFLLHVPAERFICSTFEPVKWLLLLLTYVSQVVANSLDLNVRR